MLVLAWSAQAWPCAVAYSDPAEKVRTASEDALIVWDEAGHLEHFVREAVFDTTADSFGFLVPVPARPTLADADDNLFRWLLVASAPSNEFEPRPSIARGVELTCLPVLVARGRRVPAGASLESPVVEQTRVAGLDATVLAAADAGALSAWLSEHGFALRPSLQRWIAVYVAKGWYIVAFRYERRKATEVPTEVRSGAIASRAIRITFAAQRPVYPYLEPDDVAAKPGRRLTLFLISPAPLVGSLVDGDGRPWGAQTEFSARVPVGPFPADRLPGVDLPDHPWLTQMHDRSEKRPPSDLVFTRTASASELRPPTMRHDFDTPVYVPVELPVGGAVLAWWWWWRRRRRARAAGRP